MFLLKRLWFWVGQTSSVSNSQVQNKQDPVARSDIKIELVIERKSQAGLDFDKY